MRFDSKSCRILPLNSDALFRNLSEQFIQTIDERVKKFKSRDWRQKQMTLALLMENTENRGRKEGLEQMAQLNRP